LTAIVVVITLLISGVPFFIYMATTSDKDAPQDAVNGFFSDIENKDYSGAFNRTMLNFEKMSVREKEVVAFGDSFQSYSIKLESLTRINEQNGVNITAVEARIQDHMDDYNVTVEGWSAVRMKVVMSVTGIEPYSDIIYSLLFKINGEWYLDLMSFASRPSMWTMYAWEQAHLYGALSSYSVISAHEIKLEFSGFAVPGNIVDIEIDVEKTNATFTYESSFYFSSNINGTRSEGGYPWMNSTANKMKIQSDAFTWVDANSDSLLDYHDYLILYFDEYQTGETYTFALVQMSGNRNLSTLEITLPDNPFQ
jgi:hypothetical protein